MASPKPFKTLIVEDVPEMRLFLGECVKRIPELEVVGLAQSSWEARRLLQNRRPDLVLLDEILPGESAPDFQRELEAQGVRVIALTGLKNPTHLVWNGALGRVRKPEMDSPKSRGVQTEKGFISDLTALLAKMQG